MMADLRSSIQANASLSPPGSEGNQNEQIQRQDMCNLPSESRGAGGLLALWGWWTPVLKNLASTQLEEYLAAGWVKLSKTALWLCLRFKQMSQKVV